MNLPQFHTKLREYLKMVDKSQQHLAAELGIDRVTLSNKLNQKRSFLSNYEKRAIILQLIRWKALKTATQVGELLTLLDEDISLFNPQELALLPPPKALSNRQLPIEPSYNLSSEPLTPDSPGSVETTLSPVPATPSFAPTHYSATPDTGNFYGRLAEIAQLTQWLSVERTRVVALLGMGGIGKTSLALKLREIVNSHFEVVKWVSLRDAPSPAEVVNSLLVSLLANSYSQSSPDRFEDKITLLLKYLQERRILLILDNLESVMVGGQLAGQYLSGYAGYGTLITRLAQTEHQSCIILTSRELPSELVGLEFEPYGVHVLSLRGLDEEAGLQLLQHADLKGSSPALVQLVSTYNGNPLQLKLIATHIRQLFASDIDQFLDYSEPLFGDVSQLLDQQFLRLSALEKKIIYWLAIEREPVSLLEITTNLTKAVSKSEVAAAVTALQRRSLLEVSRSGTKFTLQSVIMEFVTHKLVGQISHELKAKRFRLVTTHALLKAESKDYIREIQLRLILTPVLDKLAAHFELPVELEEHLRECLNLLRLQPMAVQGYAGGNIVNLLAKLKGHLNGCDLSKLNIRQAFLQGIALQNTDFRASNFKQTYFSGVFGSVLALAFNPAGNLLAVSDVHGAIRIWDWQQNLPLLTLTGHWDRIRTICFSPDGTILASGSDDHTVRLWDTHSGQCLYTFAGHTGRVWMVTFSPDGKLLASAGSDRRIMVWDIAELKNSSVLAGHPATIVKLSFSQDNHTLASLSEDGTLLLWDRLSWESSTLEQVQLVEAEITAFAFQPNGAGLVTAQSDRTLRLWQTTTKECVKTLYHYETEGQVWDVAFSLDGRTLAIGIANSGIALWDEASGQIVKRFANESNTQPWQLAFHPTSAIIAIGYENQMVRLWEVDSGQCLKTLNSYFNRIGAVAFQPHSEDNLLIGGGEDCLARVWDLTQKGSTQILAGHTNRVWALAFNSTGTTLATGSQDQTIRLWDSQHWQNFQTLKGSQSKVWALAFNRSGKILASCGDDPLIKLWQLETPTSQSAGSLKGHADRIRTLAFNPWLENQLLSGGDDGQLRLWDTESKECLQIYEGHQGWLRSVAFSPDGKYFASGAEDYTIRVWDIISGETVQTFSTPLSRVWSVAFSPDGRWIASGGQDQLVRVWDIESGTNHLSFRGHTGLVRTVIFNSTGQLIASGSEDGTIRLWDTTTKNCRLTLSSPRLYEGMNISATTGLSSSLKKDLKILGAIET